MIIADSSSIIYLNNIQLLDLFLKSEKVFSVTTVYDELRKKKDDIEKYFVSGRIKIINADKSIIALSSLGIADNDLISTSMKLKCYLLTDDKTISFICAELQVGTLNSFNVIIRLYEKGLIELKEAYFYIHKLGDITGYSKRILTEVLMSLP